MAIIWTPGSKIRIVKSMAEYRVEKVLLVVEGFTSEREMDRFVRSEIRYLKGFDMIAHRCASNRIKFEVDEFRGSHRYCAQLSATHPRLRLLLRSSGADECSYVQFESGRVICEEMRATGESPEQAFSMRLEDHDGAYPSEEILYHTF